MGWITDLLKEIPQAAILKEKITAIEAKYEATETENAILKDDLREAKAHIQKLEKQIKELTHIEEMSELELKMLQRLANLDHGHAISSVLLNFFPDLTLARIEYHLNRLDQLDCIRGDVTDHLGTHYGVTQKGQKILLENGLL